MNANREELLFQLALTKRAGELCSVGMKNPKVSSALKTRINA